MKRPYKEVPVEIATPTPEDTAHIAKYTHTTHSPDTVKNGYCVCGKVWPCIDSFHDGVALDSRAHTLTAIVVESPYLILEFAGVRLGVNLLVGDEPERAVAKLRELIDLIESNFNGM